MPKVYHGAQAVDEVTKNVGRPLTPMEKRVVEVEGYVPEMYLDTKLVPTVGVGQTGEWVDKTFPEALQHHVDRVKRRVKTYDDLPDYLKTELVQSEYRGDLGGSPTALKHINAGNFGAAAAEFLNHSEYNDPNTSSGIKDRIRSTARALWRRHNEQQTTGIYYGRNYQRTS